MPKKEKKIIEKKSLTFDTKCMRYEKKLALLGLFLM